MSKGVVLRIERNRAVVFTDDCRLVRLPLEPHHAVGKEIFMKHRETAADAPTPSVRRPRAFRLAAAAALAVVVALAVVFVPGWVPSAVYATVSVDVNPSLQLQLDRGLKVVAAKAMNEDAEPILAGLALKGLPWTDAVEAWAEALRTRTTLQVREMLVSAVMPEDAVALRTQLLAMEGADGPGALAGIQVRALYSNDLEVAVRAAENGLSIGRQMLLTQSQLQERTWTRATIGGAELGELLRELIRNQEQDQTRYTWRKNAEGTVTPGGKQGEVTPGGNQGEVTPGGNQGDITPGGNQGDITPGGNQGDITPGGSGGPGNGNCTPTCEPTCEPTGSQYQGGK